jgi:hypothetical protein
MSHTTIVISGNGLDVSAIGRAKNGGLHVVIRFPERSDNPEIRATLVKTPASPRLYGPQPFYSLQEVHFEQDDRKPYSLGEIHALVEAVAERSFYTQKIFKALWFDYDKAN